MTLKHAKRLLAWPVVVALFFFWWLTLSRLGVDWEGTLAQARGREGFLGLALAGAAAYFVMQAVVWRHIVSRLVAPVPWLLGLRLWAITNFARYLPGAMWHLVGRVYLGGEAGVSRTSGLLGVVLEQGLQLIAAALLFVLTIPFWWPGSGVTNFTWVVALVPVGLVCMHPRLFFGLLNAVLLRLKREPLPVTLRARDLLGYLLLFLATHAANALALAAIVRALSGDWAFWPTVVGAAMVAWIAGLLNLLTPGGLGTREVVLSLVLGPALGANVTAAAALLWRAANILTEALCVVGLHLLWVVAGRSAPAASRRPSEVEVGS